MIDIDKLIKIINSINNKNYLLPNIKKIDINLYNEIIYQFNNSIKKFKNANEFIYCLINNLLPFGGCCKNCGKLTKYNRWNDGYREYCSASCANKDKEKINKTKENNIIKYGVSNTLMTEENKKKALEAISYTKEEYLEKLDNKYSKGEYILLSEYKTGSDVVLKFRHTKCGKEFDKRKDLILNQHGCPYCGRENRKTLRYTNEEFIKLCNENNNGQFTPLEEFKGVDLPIKLHCNKCGKDFIRGRANDVIHKKLGCHYCDYNSYSRQEIELQEFIESLNIKYKTNDRTSIKPLELDIFVPNLNIGIEYNGLYWHSELNKDKNYHYDKFKKCYDNNIRLIQVFEDEWINKQDIVKSKIKNILNVNDGKRIYARKCIIKEISSKEKNIFLNKYHIQGEDKSKYKIGIYYNNELVGVMTFGSPRKALGQSNNNEGDYELVRFATNNNYIVVGGFSKCLKYFIRKYNPKKIITYADLRWTDPKNNIYINNGFSEKHFSDPNYWYITKSNAKERLFRYNYRKSNLKKLFPSLYSEEKSESEIMKEAGYLRIWDCGNIVYEYNFE